jgi:hypothetical protein
LFYITTTKYTRLQVLVFTLFAIKSLSLEWRVSFNCSNVCILPVNTRSHQCSVALVVMQPVLFSGLAVILFRDLDLDRDVRLRLYFAALRPLNLIVMRARFICSLILTKEYLGAFRLAP